MAEDLAHVRLASQALVQLIRAAIDLGRTNDVIDVHEAWLRDLEMWSRPDDSGRSEIGDLRNAEEQLRLGLGFWTIRAGARGNSAAPSILRYFATSFESPPRVLRAVGAALRTAIESDEWLDWTEPPRFGGTYSAAVDLELLQSGLAMCVLLILDGASSNLPPMEWLPLHLGSATKIVRNFSSPSWTWLFGEVENLSETTSKLADALVEATQEQRAMEDERVRHAPISDSLSRNLERRLLAKWDEYSMVRKVFARAKKLRTKTQEGPKAARRVVRVNLLRSYLIEGNGDSNELIATEPARLLARIELEVLVSHALNVPLSGDSSTTLTDRLDSALAEIEAPAKGALVILMPVNPVIEVELGLRQPFDARQSDSPLFGASGVGQWYRGTIRGTPVLQYRTVPRDRVIVVGSEWGHYIEWIPAETAVQIELVDVKGEPPHSRQPQVELSVSRYSDIVVQDNSKATAFKIDDLERTFA